MRSFAGKFAIILALAFAAFAPAQGGVTSGSGAVAGQINQGPQPDPNMPPLTSMIDGPIYWTVGTPTMPVVHFKNPAADGTYLGFNENGSLIRSPATGKVYYWKLTDRNTMTGTLTVAFNGYKDIPLDTLAALQNPSSQTTSTLALNGRGPKGPKPAPVTVAGGNPPPKPPQANPFGPNAGNALAGLASSGAPTSDIAGTDARVTNGILTFTLRSGAKSKPYNVARPKVMANNPQAAGAGIAGAWIAMEDGGNGVLFTVEGDNSVTGKEIPATLVQMLMQGGH
jgi:hypothetical protein